MKQISLNFKKIHFFAKLIFTAYIIFLLALTLYNRPISPLPLSTYINLFAEFIPFKTFIEYFNLVNDGVLSIWQAIYQIMGNLLLFFPMGILFPMVFTKLKSAKKCLPIIVCIILILETFQLLIKIGSFDITDVILNTLGAIFGYLLYRFITHKIFEKD